MIGLRVPAAMLRKIDKFADAFSVNRTNTLRFLLEAGIEAKAHYVRRGRGSRIADRVVRAVMADAKAKAAERAAERPALAGAGFGFNDLPPTGCCVKRQDGVLNPVPLRPFLPHCPGSPPLPLRDLDSASGNWFPSSSPMGTATSHDHVAVPSGRVAMADRHPAAPNHTRDWNRRRPLAGALPGILPGAAARRRPSSKAIAYSKAVE